MICTGEARTALYRFFDADENLPYVGITDDPWRRWREHVRQKPWYPQVKHQAVTWYETRTAAEIAEQVAIKRERPRFNKAGAVRPIVDEPPATQEAPPAIELQEAQPTPEPEPAPESLEPPVPAQRKRTPLVVLTCIAWAFLPSMPGLPSWRNPWMIALVISTIIPTITIMLIAGARCIHRFGRWLDTTFTPGEAARA